MPNDVCLNADKTREVPCESEEAAFRYSREDADRILAEAKAAKQAANKARSAGENK